MAPAKSIYPLVLYDVQANHPDSGTKVKLNRHSNKDNRDRPRYVLSKVSVELAAILLCTRCAYYYLPYVQYKIVISK